MRSFIIGTAGHIDHGKSSLVHALTGTDPDRLKEEKERGITIDLGFAHVDFSKDITASFIDVPGHEKFIRNMLAGVAGIDAVLLVVAATEGVKPQTREHFDICRMLGIERGLVALTKTDAADDGAIERAEAGARSLVARSFLEGAPLIRVSSRTGEGLGDLRAALLKIATDAPARADGGLVRLPIDRVFTLRGFGTVVTGTLTGGRLNVGDDVVALPSEKKARVRGIQVHGETRSAVQAGERTALNLAGVLVSDLSRGDVLIREGTLRATRVAHVSLSLLQGVSIKRDARVRIHAGSAEVLGRVRFPEAAITDAASPVVVEMRFESRIVLGRGDRLVLRSYSPSRTIGGARVLDPFPRPRTRGLLTSLAMMADETDTDTLGRFLVEAGPAGLSLAALAARWACNPGVMRERIATLPSAVPVSSDRSHFVHSDVMAALETSAIARMAESHQADPLAQGLSLEELRRRVFAKALPSTFDVVLARLNAHERVTELADRVALKSHRIQLAEPEEAARAAIESALLSAGLGGVALASLHVQIRREQKASENAVRVLVQEKVAERIGTGLLVSRAALEAFKDQAKARFRSGSRLDVSEVKHLTGLSRKYVIPLLEWLDRERVTRRVGADRIVL